jgi:NADPH-dependent 2,4-dienoyl-CoA reductase/sulfur reductase-like enzyme
VLIVGAGPAGWQLAETLRQHDADLPITLLSACAGDRYDKPLLSVALARQLGPEALCKERGADAARRLGVRLLAHTRAVRICADTRQLRTRGCPTARWCWRTAPTRPCPPACRRHCAGASTTSTPTWACAAPWAHSRARCWWSAPA